MYRRITYADRCQIYAFLAVKKGVLEISRELSFHPSTIYRELKRNSPAYHPDRAHARAKVQFERCRRKLLLVGAHEQAVLAKLKERWSPEQIAHRYRLEGSLGMSHETVYRYIRQRPHLREDWRGLLRRYQKPGVAKRSLRARPSWMRSIHERPKIADERREFGHWERDTMYGKLRQMILVCAERKSRLIKLARVKEPWSVHLTDQTKDLLSEASKRRLKSITNDNGGELADGFAFSVPVYYCDPRKPQQRGSVENAIGLLRQYVPKGTDLNTISEQSLKAIEEALNHRPRKCLDWKTPYEVFFQKSVALAM